MSQEYADNLEKSRESAPRKSKKEDKKSSEKSSSRTSPLHHTEMLIDWLFVLSLTFSILKDISDPINNALIAAGGTGLPILFAFSTLASSFILFTTIISSSVQKSGGRLKYRILQKILMILVGYVVESIPLLSIMPWESIITFRIFWMTLKERRDQFESENQQ